MHSVHNFVKSILRNRNIKLKYNFYNQTGFKGLCMFEENIIYVCADQDKNELELTMLHECFHHYFRDEHDSRKRSTKNDPVERRAEDSAKNMLMWYNSNISDYTEYKALVDGLPKSHLTKEELEDL